MGLKADLEKEVRDILKTFCPSLTCQEVFKISGCEWKTKTPFASIRRIVQLDKNI